MRKYRIMQTVFLYSCISCMTMHVSAEPLVELKKIPKYDYKEREEDTSEPISEWLGIPQHYQNSVSDSTGRLTVKTDADVIFSDVSGVDVVKVTPHPLDQEFIDLVTEIFFPDAVIYDKRATWKSTKQELQELINELEGYIAEGNYDPYGSGKRTDGEFCYNIEEDLERCKLEYTIAPDDRQLIEKKPALFTDWEVIYTSDGPEKRLCPEFDGIVQMPDGEIYDYALRSYESIPLDIIITKREGEEEKISRWDEDLETTPPADFTIEEAQIVAEEKISEMGLDNMKLTRGTFAKLVTSVEGSEMWEVSNYGYLLHYTGNVDGIPITYAGNIGAWPEDITDTSLHGWDYEELEFAVTQDGIHHMRLKNYYDVGEILFHNVNLLPFDEITSIFNSEMVDAYAPYIEQFEEMGFDIDTITFGYTRIYQPYVTEEEGILVPAWDFFGEKTAYPEIETYPYTSNYVTPAKSLLTINAIDGSVIDRSLGY